MLTRRQTNGLLIAATLAPGQALAQRKKKKKRKKRGKYERPPVAQPALAAKLTEVLNSHLIRGCGGTFSIPAFEAGQIGNDKVMIAVVRLDWPPGWRQRRFRAATPNQQNTFEDLTNEVLLEYAKAWPGCVV